MYLTPPTPDISPRHTGLSIYIKEVIKKKCLKAPTPPKQHKIIRREASGNPGHVKEDPFFVDIHYEVKVTSSKSKCITTDAEEALPSASGQQGPSGHSTLGLEQPREGDSTAQPAEIPSCPRRAHSPSISQPLSKTSPYPSYAPGRGRAGHIHMNRAESLLPICSISWGDFLLSLRAG